MSADAIELARQQLAQRADVDADESLAGIPNYACGRPDDETVTVTLARAVLSLAAERDEWLHEYAVKDETLKYVTAQLDALRAERDNLTEFIRASKECQDGFIISDLADENDRYRKAFTEAVSNLQASGSIRAAHCNWCGERWPMLEGEPASAAFEHSKRHAMRCKSNPLRIERDAVNEENASLTATIVTLRAALAEACDIADELGYGHGDIPAHRRVAELRALAEGEQ